MSLIEIREMHTEKPPNNHNFVPALISSFHLNVWFLKILHKNLKLNSNSILDVAQRFDWSKVAQNQVGNHIFFSFWAYIVHT